MFHLRLEKPEAEWPDDLSASEKTKTTILTIAGHPKFGIHIDVCPSVVKNPGKRFLSELLRIGKGEPICDDLPCGKNDRENICNHRFPAAGKRETILFYDFLSRKGPKYFSQAISCARKLQNIFCEQFSVAGSHGIFLGSDFRRRKVPEYFVGTIFCAGKV